MHQKLQANKAIILTFKNKNHWERSEEEKDKKYMQVQMILFERKKPSFHSSSVPSMAGLCRMHVEEAGTLIMHSFQYAQHYIHLGLTDGKCIHQLFVTTMKCMRQPKLEKERGLFWITFGRFTRQDLAGPTCSSFSDDILVGRVLRQALMARDTEHMSVFLFTKLPRFNHGLQPRN